MPKVLFNVALQAERHERKSHKEESFMSKNIIYMILTVLVAPVIATGTYSYFHYQYERGYQLYGASKYPKKVLPN
jgi:hypothetical protein